MVTITALWLPILVAAILVFIASSIVHAVLPFHQKDYGKMANEDVALAAMRQAGVKPGDYMFPYAPTPKAMQAPDMVKKLEQGPLGFMTVLPNGVPAMGGQLVQWFVYCVVVSIVAAYVTGRTLAPGAEYLAAFRVAGTVAFVAYAGAHPSMSIWYRRNWGTTVRYLIDGFIYGLLTGGAFGWLWP